MIVGSLLSVLVTITLAIRLYARKWLTRGFGLDDIFILLAYFPATAFTIVGIIGESYFQWNRRNLDVEDKVFVQGHQLVFANQMLFDIATSLTKLSILTLVYRFTTASRDRKMTNAVMISIAFICVIYVIFIIVSVTQCRPLSDYWKGPHKSQNCINQGAHLMAVSIINTATDWLVVLLPIKTALSLNLAPRHVKVIIFLFGIGITASIAGAVRSYYSWKLTVADDYMWVYWEVWFSSTIELNLGIICASVPATKPFFSSFLPNTFESIFRRRDSMDSPWDRKPLTISPAFTTFIDHSSSTSLPRHPTRPSPTHYPANLNKPLPPIIDTVNSHVGLEMRIISPGHFNPHPRSPKIPGQQLSMGLSNKQRDLVLHSPQTQDRTTIIIMYRGDEAPRPTYQIPTGARLA